MIGQMSNFQLFSSFLDIEMIKTTGCGLRADLFDSLYDPLVFIGDQLNRTITTTEFCGQATGMMATTIYAYTMLNT